jgi:hypothetical protein
MFNMRHEWNHAGQQLAADADGTIRRAFPNPHGPVFWWDDLADAEPLIGEAYGARFGLEAAAREILCLAEENERLKSICGEAEAALLMATCGCSASGGFKCSRCKALAALRPGKGN